MKPPTTSTLVPAHHTVRFPLAMVGMAVVSCIVLVVVRPHQNSNGFLGNPLLIFLGAIPVAFMGAAFMALRNSPDKGLRLIGRIGLVLTILILIALTAIFLVVWYGLRSLMAPD